MACIGTTPTAGDSFGTYKAASASKIFLRRQTTGQQGNDVRKRIRSINRQGALHRHRRFGEKLLNSAARP